jgi:hypothetical protein
MGLFKSVFRPVRTDPAQRDLTFPLAPPHPSQKNHPQPTQKPSPSRLPHHQCVDPGADSLVSPRRHRLNVSCLGR